MSNQREAILPGLDEVTAPPEDMLQQRRLRRGNNYKPRTRHLLPDGTARYTNRLFLESSPYLLQHAHNPVNWFPWGEEAFEIARRTLRPVLVSIGYATCHWCHVMEEESFEDEEIARFLNENFVAVKVDREERPDLDSVYMSALHAMGSQGGWPLNVFLTPERKPFYGGTYFPPRDHSRGIGFLSLLKRLKEAFDREPDRIALAGRQLGEAVRDILASATQVAAPEERSLAQAAETYRVRFDAENGGLAGAPKFPSSLPLRLLLRHHRKTGDRSFLGMTRLTLQKMAAGGIYDQIGGGFHRYATDESWQVPHFEKMLYDNALLTVTYLDGYQVVGDPELARVVREILRYLTREMVAPNGGFYSATDADSLAANGEREEGIFFTWTPQELDEVLGAEKGRVIAAYWGVTPGGNFEGRSIPHRDRSLQEVAESLNLAAQTVQEIVEQSREILYQARLQRPKPLRDEKILASWNGLAISAFARAGMVLNESSAVAAASDAARFVMQEMTRDGRLVHSHQEGAPKGEGFLDDYAFVIAGLIDLYQATGRLDWLEHAVRLCQVVQRDFLDEEVGGYYMSGPHHEELIAREKPAYDGAVPSGNSVMIMNLLRLHLLTEQTEYQRAAERAFAAFGSRLGSAPTAVPEMLLALDFYLDTPEQIVIVAPEGNRPAAMPLFDQLRTVFLPNAVVVLACEGEEMSEAGALIPSLRDKKAQGNQAVAYLCVGKTCQPPTSSVEAFRQQLEQRGKPRSKEAGQDVATARKSST